MQPNETVFDLIMAKKIPSWIVWEDDKHLAFLTPFPNTPGMTVVIPKANPGDNVFEIDNVVYHELMDATKKVAQLLKKAFKVSRVGVVFEGTGVAHVHAKLFPFHGEKASQTGVWSLHQEFYPEYVGYMTTVEGPKMSDEELTKVQEKIIAAK